MQFNYNEDYPPADRSVVSANDDRAKFPVSHIKSCYRDNCAQVLLRDGRVVEADIIVPWILIPDDSDDEGYFCSEDEEYSYHESESEGEAEGGNMEGAEEELQDVGLEAETDDKADSNGQDAYDNDVDMIASASESEGENEEGAEEEVQDAALKGEADDRAHSNGLDYGGEYRPTYAYMLERSIRDTLYGKVWQALVLRSVNLSDREDVIWVVTEKRCAIKISNKIEITQNAHADDPISEVHAMQYLRQRLEELHTQEHEEETEIETILKADQIMLDRNVMLPYEALEDNDFLYTAMPFCPGCELWDLTHKKRFDEDQARYLFNQMLIGIETLQSAGICHRDIGLENILYNRNDQAIIIDFGMSLRIYYDENGDRCKFARDRSCGKVLYKSPEIFTNEEPFDGHAVDIWALGPLLFMLVTGRPPWEEASLANELFRCFSKGHLGATLQSWNWNLSPNLICLLQRMFFLDPADRLSLDQIRAHPWMDGPMTPPPYEINQVDE